MFSIKFISEARFSPRRNETVALGEITLGEFVENFESSLSFWEKDDYRQHWNKAAQRILDNKNSSLITDLYDPRTANFIVWWKMWKVGERIFVQNQLLFLDQLKEQFELDNPFKFVGERNLADEDGITVSEWELSLRDVVKFLETND